VKIRFANDYTTPGGRTYKAGTVHEIRDNAEARRLIHRGKAVAASDAEEPEDFGSKRRGQRASANAEKQRPGNSVRATTDSAAAEKPTPVKGKGKD
jgi:hypothetical protein